MTDSNLNMIDSITEKIGNLNINSSVNESKEIEKSNNNNSKRVNKKENKNEYKIGFCFDERMLLHKTIEYQPYECPERAMAVYINLVLKDIRNRLYYVPSIECTEEDILRVHNKEYLENIKNLQFDEKGKLINKKVFKEKESYSNESTYISSRIAAGSLINVCKNILSHVF